jgi:flagellar hook protein FlgE
MSFQQGLSGLNATSKNLEVIGNNVANSEHLRREVFARRVRRHVRDAMNGAGSTGAGIGVSVAAIAQQFTQGNITSTDNPLDMAIKGAGFFQVRDTNNQVLYTRNGQFKLDRTATSSTTSCSRLMGYPANAQGVIQPGQAGPLQLPTAGIEPSPTSRVALEINLDARAASRCRASGPADRLQRRDDLQQRDLDDDLRRQGPGRRVDLLLPEGRHRQLERLRRRQRHVDPRHGGTPPVPLPADDDPVPGRRRRADHAGRHGLDRHPDDDQFESAPRRCRSAASR